jgi:hypothetical protein
MSVRIEIKLPDNEERSRYSTQDREYLVLKVLEGGSDVEVHLEHLKIKVSIADLVRAVRVLELSSQELG